MRMLFPRSPTGVAMSRQGTKLAQGRGNAQSRCPAAPAAEAADRSQLRVSFQTSFARTPGRLCGWKSVG